MQPAEVIEVQADKVGCDGGDGPLGHPLIYMTFDSTGKVDCPYCSRRFIRREGGRAQEH